MSYLDRFEQTAAMPAKQSFDKLPVGTYVAQITDVEIKIDGIEDCHRISVEFTINEGDFKGRKTWWNTKISEKTSDKAFSFIKGTICKMAGVESTNGDTFGVLDSAKGNLVEINVAYKAGTTDPSKEYAQIYVEKMLLPF